MFLHRFRQVPTFGRDTIRKFGGNVSAMKKRAGRDIEDILQVSAFCRFCQIRPLRCDLPTSSVGFQSWKIYYRTGNTTRPYLISPLISPPGMRMGNSACTQRTRSHPFEHRQRNLAVNSVTMPTTCVPSMQRNRCQVRPPLRIAARPQRPRRLLSLLNRPTHQTQNQVPAKTHTPHHSTSKHTRSMQSETILTILNSSVQQTAFLRNRSVLLALDPPLAHHASLVNRVNLSIGGLRSFTSEPTRHNLSARLRNTSGWNATTASTSAR